MYETKILTINLLNDNTAFIISSLSSNHRRGKYSLSVGKMRSPAVRDLEIMVGVLSFENKEGPLVNNSKNILMCLR